jgi:hypothetical protein
MTMNLVAIAGVPFGESVTLPPGYGPSRPYQATTDDKRAMWMALAALGAGAVVGYVFLGDLVRRAA